MIGAPRFQNGSLTLLKNKTTPATWFFRFYEERNGRRSYRNQRIGTIKELPHRRDAEKAVHELRANINSSVRIPETISELISHYKKFELGEDTDKRATTCSVYELYLDRQLVIRPRGSAQACRRRLTESGVQRERRQTLCIPLASRRIFRLKFHDRQRSFCCNARCRCLLCISSWDSKAC